jgi:ADP-ribose pyrophosphatase
VGEPWERVDSRQLADHGFFQIRQDRNKHPRHGREYDFFIFEFPHWVNIIPLTAEGDVLFIRQFRHGTREVTWEIPGGIIDPGESPKQAALREMEEETGFRAADALELGWVNPNPAIQENRCWTFLAEGVEEVGGQHTEGSEAIDVVRVPLADIPGMFESGEISHALVVTAFHFYRQHLGHPLV